MSFKQDAINLKLSKALKAMRREDMEEAYKRFLALEKHNIPRVNFELGKIYMDGIPSINLKPDQKKGKEMILSAARNCKCSIAYQYAVEEFGFMEQELFDESKIIKCEDNIDETPIIEVNEMKKSCFKKKNKKICDYLIKHKWHKAAAKIFHSPFALLVLGDRAYSEEDPLKAKQYYMKVIASYDTVPNSDDYEFASSYYEAYYKLANLYRLGYGVPQNMDVAINFMYKAFKGLHYHFSGITLFILDILRQCGYKMFIGLPNVLYLHIAKDEKSSKKFYDMVMKILKHHPDDYDCLIGIYLLLTVCDAGDFTYELGEAFLAIQDGEEAAKYFDFHTKVKDPDKKRIATAAYNAAKIYDEGKFGVKKDTDYALKMYEKILSNDSDLDIQKESNLRVAQISLEHKEVYGDTLAKAKKCFEKVIELSNNNEEINKIKEEIEKIDSFNKKMSDEVQRMKNNKTFNCDNKETVIFCKDAVEQGYYNFGVYKILATAYEEGKFIEKDIEKAIQLFSNVELEKYNGDIEDIEECVCHAMQLILSNNGEPSRIHDLYIKYIQRDKIRQCYKKIAVDSYNEAEKLYKEKKYLEAIDYLEKVMCYDKNGRFYYLKGTAYFDSLKLMDLTEDISSNEKIKETVKQAIESLNIALERNFDNELMEMKFEEIDKFIHDYNIDIDDFN